MTKNIETLNINIQCDLWTYLKSQTRPIVMYGMGNGADKILAVCASFGIEIQDFFASDGFVRGNLFHGKPVLSYSAICEKYGKGNFIVLLSFASSLDTVIENIKRIALETELYAPDVPVFGEGLFDLDYFKSNYGKFNQTFNLLADDRSKQIFKNVIMYKLSGKIDFLFDAESDESEVYSEILSPRDYRTYVDLGAYNGDTVRRLLEYTDSLRDVIAFEPDKRSFKKLQAYAESEQRCRIRAYNVAAWSEHTTLTFDDSGNRNSNVSIGAKTNTSAKIREVTADALDSILLLSNTDRVDYIKYDVEGSEREAILGSLNTIKRYLPDLLISVYHRNGDMFELPQLISSIAPEYKLYLRRSRYIPAWDLNLYCIKRP